MPVDSEFHTPPFAPSPPPTSAQRPPPTNPIHPNRGLHATIEDQRVFAVPHTYGPPHHGPDDFVTRRVDNGPSFIVVGCKVDDARMLDHLPGLSESYGVTLAQLQAARGGETVCVRGQPDLLP